GGGRSQGARACAFRSRALSRSTWLGGRGRREPHRGRNPRRWLHGRTHSDHAARDGGGIVPARAAGERGSGRGGALSGSTDGGRKERVMSGKATRRSSRPKTKARAARAPREMRGEQAADRAVERVVQEIRRGHMVVVVDDEHRENEGDLIMAAEKATPE